MRIQTSSRHSNLLSLLLCALVFVCLGAPAAAAPTTIAYWNFNEGMGTDTRAKWSKQLPASKGSGYIFLYGFRGGTEDYEGTSLNALPYVAAGASLTLVSGAGVSANGSSVLVAFSTEGLQDVVVTFATRGTPLGMNEGHWEYSIDGISSTPVGENTASNIREWGVETVDLSEIDEIDDQPYVFLRYQLDGAMATASNTRIDNLMVSAGGPVGSPGGTRCGDMDGD
ncbi:MAG: hypothetical protein JRH19_03435, partial [Deltaproteobacteria bacterium]|nr:hypothetical protein [Deltaproteobacteria bacterium]